MKNMFDELFKSFNDSLAEMNKQMDEAYEQHKKDHPEQAACDHGVVYDKEAADKLMTNIIVDPKADPAVSFIMGSSISGEIRKRWPRLHGPCPKGCGFNGIAYASYEHYIAGDW